MKRLGKCDIIFEDLRSKILSGVLQAGDRITESELCRKYGVSRVTARAALALLRRKNLIETCSGSGSYVKGIADQKGNRVALVIENSERGLINMTNGVVDVLSKYGIMTEFYITNGSAENEREICYTAIKNKVDGLIVFSSHETVESVDFFQNAILRGHRIIFAVHSPPLKICDFVKSDGVRGAFRAANRLIELNHRRIAYVGSFEYRDLRERFGGFMESLKLSGIPFDRRYLINIKKSFSSEKSDDGRLKQAIADIMEIDNPPTAFLCANDYIAFNTIKYLKRMGYSIPEDISVIGFDNIYDDITSVSQDFYLLGHTAAQIFVDKYTGKMPDNLYNLISIPMELTDKKSTGLLKPVL